MTKRSVTVEIDLETVAESINEGVGEDVETAASVATWLDDNQSMVCQLLQDSLIETIGEAYG